MQMLMRALERCNPSRLKHLDLSDNYLSDSGVQTLARVLETGRLSGLQHLDFSHNPIKDAGGFQLAKALKAGSVLSLTHLNLSHAYLGNEGLIYLMKALECGLPSALSLQDLDLSANVFDSHGAVSLASVLESGFLPTLRNLNLSYTMIGEKGGVALGRVMKMGRLSGLRHLSLNSCSLSSNALLSMTMAMEDGKLPGLKSLDLSGTYLHENVSSAFVTALSSGKLTDLQHLALADCGIVAEVLEHILTAVKDGHIWNLRHLDLSKNFLSFDKDYKYETGSLALAELIRTGRLAQLQSLDLSHCTISDDGMIALFQSIGEGHLPNLRQLLLEDNDPREDRSILAMGRFFESGVFSQLDELKLGTNGVGDDLAMALASQVEESKKKSRNPLPELLRSSSAALEFFRSPKTAVSLEKFWNTLLAGGNVRDSSLNSVRPVEGGAAPLPEVHEMGRRPLPLSERPQEAPSSRNSLLFNSFLVCLWLLYLLFWR